jgi:hypothetical protein
MLEDIAILTGGTMVSADLGIKLENVTVSMLGRAKKVMIDKENTTIVGGAGKKADIQARITQIKVQIEETTIVSVIDRSQTEMKDGSGSPSDRTWALCTLQPDSIERTENRMGCVNCESHNQRFRDEYLECRNVRSSRPRRARL